MKFLTTGRYPTDFISRLVRDNGLMDLEQAHWRLSGYSAMAAGFTDRGFLREGAPADIVVYDYDVLRSLPPSVSTTSRPTTGAWPRRPRAIA